MDGLAAESVKAGTCNGRAGRRPFLEGGGQTDHHKADEIFRLRAFTLLVFDAGVTRPGSRHHTVGVGPDMYKPE